MAELKRHRDVLERVLETGNSTATLQVRIQNVRKFRKFEAFHRPVTGISELLLRSYTKIVTPNRQKMVS